MTRGAGAQMPQQRGKSPCEALEMQVEAMWLRLGQLGPKCQRTVCLSPASGRLVLRHPSQQAYAGEVGTYTRSVELSQLRDDCFAVFQGAKR